MKRHAAWAIVVALLAACQPSPPPQVRAHAEIETTPRARVSPVLIAAARQQIGVTRLYDPAYVEMPYPGGDVPADRGVCTDVVVRALRTTGLDLQRKIHEDIRAHFAEYPQTWGLNGPDRNIDHRRVPNQMRWFERQGWARSMSALPGDYAPGDIVAWKLSGSGLLHIGIVSDRKARDGTPLILHNIGRGTQEENLLFAHAIIGHYRPSLADPQRRS